MHEGNPELTDWLEGALTLEEQSAELLEAPPETISELPALAHELRLYLQETKFHHGAVTACLKRRRDDRALGRPASESGAGVVPRLPRFDDLPGDPLLRHVFRLYATEAAKVAMYRCVVEGSRHLGEEEITRTFESVLAREEAMMRSLWGHLPHLTVRYLSHDALTAKR